MKEKETMTTPSTTKVKKTDKFVFKLNNIKPEKVYQKYNITFSTNLASQGDPGTTTKISDLMEKKLASTISYLDESKHVHKCVISTTFHSNGGIYSCFWCRNGFETQPIGIPINYIPKKAVKTYFSEISKDVYTIKENITRDRSSLITPDLIVNEYDTYETDGVVCSWNCMAAFIQEHKSLPMYNKSPTLLYKMYRDVMGQEAPEKIIPAPHWRCLKEYGGTRTIKEFREGFNKLSYEFHGIVKNITSPISYLFEEHVRL